MHVSKYKVGTSIGTGKVWDVQLGFGEQSCKLWDVLYEREQAMRCYFIMIVSGIGMEKENSKCLK